jgi:hypothetical protein
MAKGKKTGGGSRKGSENRSTVAAREAFQFAFHGIGGIAALVAWAKKNRTEFYKLYARLIPTETHVTGADGEPLGIVILPRKEIDSYTVADGQA